jgi:glyoxylase-like metal-dependent hydrolase (beta-lactamase superfamily II)
MRGLLTIGALSVVLFSPTAAAQAPESETTRIGDGVYQFRFRSHNNVFVVTSEGVVAFDPISSEAARLYAREIRRVAPDSPLLAIVYSHDHADHTTGADVLRTELGVQHDVPIIAHEAARAKIEAAGNADQPPPDVTFSGLMTLWFGGRRLELHYLGKSHSDNMIVALLPEERIAFAVDFVSNDRVGFQSLPDYHFPDFFEALERLRGLDFDTIVFGHGPSGDRAAIDRQIQYYADVRNAVTAAHRRGLTEDEAAAQIRLPAYQAWGAYEDWFELNVRAIYRWVAGGGGGGGGGGG